MGSPNQELRREIRRLFEAGRIYRGRWIHVRVAPSLQGRIIFSIRSKFGKAVLRNRARRRLRAICLEFMAAGCTDRLMLISLGDRARNVSYKDLRADLLTAFKGLGILDP